MTHQVILKSANDNVQITRENLVNGGNLWINREVLHLIGYPRKVRLGQIMISQGLSIQVRGISGPKWLVSFSSGECWKFDSLNVFEHQAARRYS